MLNRIKAEPVLVSALIVALLNLAAAFGLDLSAGQTAAINALVAAGLAIVVRANVSPTSAE
jgi:hypothetical protein